MEKEKEKKRPMHKHYVIAFWVTLGISIGLMVGSAFVPPLFVIDGSIFKAVGLLFLWPALAFAAKALEEGKIAKISKGNTTISVGHKYDESTAEIEEHVDDENLEYSK